MEFLWQLSYMLIALFALGVIPFLIFYYEAEDPESRQYQCWTALKYGKPRTPPHSGVAPLHSGVPPSPPGTRW